MLIPAASTAGSAGGPAAIATSGGAESATLSSETGDHCQWALVICTAESLVAVLNPNSLEPLLPDAWLRPKNSSPVVAMALLDANLVPVDYDGVLPLAGRHVAGAGSHVEGPG